MILLGVGNIIATSWTIPSKIKAKQMGLLKMRFTRLDKYFWSHSNRTQNLPKVSLFLNSEFSKMCPKKVSKFSMK